MDWLWSALPALACGAMMLVICVPMMFGKKKDRDPADATTREEIAALREEVAALRAERALQEREDARG